MTTIVVLDDYLPGRSATVALLERAGYDVREAATGQQTLHLLGLAPDLVVLDLKLPDIDGFELTRRIRAAAGASLPIIHKTAIYGDPQHRAAGLAAGANAYFSDPVDPDAFLKTVRDLLERRRR